MSAEIREAWQAVITAPDRESLLEAYRLWYDLAHGSTQQSDNDSEQSGWIDTLDKYYGGLE